MKMICKYFALLTVIFCFHGIGMSQKMMNPLFQNIYLCFQDSIINDTNYYYDTGSVKWSIDFSNNDESCQIYSFYESGSIASKTLIFNLLKDSVYISYGNNRPEISANSILDIDQYGFYQYSCKEKNKIKFTFYENDRIRSISTNSYPIEEVSIYKKNGKLKWHGEYHNNEPITGLKADRIEANSYFVKYDEMSKLKYVFEMNYQGKVINVYDSESKLIRKNIEKKKLEQLYYLINECEL